MHPTKRQDLKAEADRIRGTSSPTPTPSPSSHARPCARALALTDHLRAALTASDEPWKAAEEAADPIQQLRELCPPAPPDATRSRSTVPSSGPSSPGAGRDRHGSIIT